MESSKHQYLKNAKTSDPKKTFSYSKSKLSAVSKMFDNIDIMIDENKTKFKFTSDDNKLIVEQLKRGGQSLELFRMKMQNFITNYLEIVHQMKTREQYIIQLFNHIGQESFENTGVSVKFPQIAQAYLHTYNLFHTYKKENQAYHGLIENAIEAIEKQKKNESKGSNIIFRNLSKIFNSESQKNIKVKSQIPSKSLFQNYDSEKKHLAIISDLKRDHMFISQKNELLQQNIGKYKEIQSEMQTNHQIELHNLEQAMKGKLAQQRQKWIEEEKNRIQLAKRQIIQQNETNMIKIKVKYQRQTQKLQKEKEQLEKENQELKSKLLQTKRQSQSLRLSQSFKLIEKPKGINRQSKKQKQKINMSTGNMKLKYGIATENKSKKGVKVQQVQQITAQYRNIFQGEILNRDPNHKKYLIELVQLHTKKTIQYTNLLYTLDLKNPTNVHQYIDGYPNLLLLIQMKNGHKLGAFSFGFLQPTKQYSIKFGFLFSLTNKKSFLLNLQNSESKSLIYEQNCIIFGNSELRVHCDSEQVFSNLGIANRYMGKKGDKANELLGQGQGKRQGQAKSYQFYKILFED